MIMFTTTKNDMHDLHQYFPNFRHLQTPFMYHYST